MTAPALGTTVVHRRYVPYSQAHYAGNLVDGAFSLAMFGDAAFRGSLGGQALAQPVVDRHPPAHASPRRVGRHAAAPGVVGQLLLKCLYTRAKLGEFAGQCRVTLGLLEPVLTLT